MTPQQQALHTDALRAKIATLETQLQQHPNHPGLLQQLSRLYIEAQDPYRAGALLERAVQLAPTQPQLQYELAAVFAAVGKAETAEIHYARAVALAPNFLAAHLSLAQLLQSRGAGQASIPHCDAILAQQPNNALALRMRSCAAQQVRDHVGAERFARRLIPLAPDHVDNLTLLGAMLKIQRKPEQALPYLQRAAALAPGHSAALFCLADIQVTLGQYGEGFASYARALDAIHSPGIHEARQRVAHLPAWQQGQPLAGQRILIWNDQGLGDVIMLARYLPKLFALGASAVGVLCTQTIVPLLAHMDARIQIHAEEENNNATLRDYDLQSRMGWLPARCFDPAQPIPFEQAYLHVPDSLVTEWRARLGDAPGERRVGLVWAGNAITPFTQWRDMPLRTLAPLFGTPNTRFISLQFGKERSQIAAQGAPLTDLMDQVRHFADTAALICNLDLVIAVDTAVAHLAGALGKPVWLLNRYESEWRWQLDRTDTPWYPSMRLINQKTPGDWKPCVREMRDALLSLPRAATP